jgi:ankyrin repeat protein
MAAFAHNTGAARKLLAKLLLEHGADPNIAEDDRFTPLDAAVAKGNPELAELLRTHMGA